MSRGAALADPSHAAHWRPRRISVLLVATYRFFLLLSLSQPMIIYTLRPSGKCWILYSCRCLRLWLKWASFFLLEKFEKKKQKLAAIGNVVWPTNLKRRSSWFILSILLYWLKLILQERIFWRLLLTNHLWPEHSQVSLSNSLHVYYKEIVIMLSLYSCFLPFMQFEIVLFKALILGLKFLQRLLSHEYFLHY